MNEPNQILSSTNSDQGTAISINSRIRVRHALARWAIENRQRATGNGQQDDQPAATKNITITRSNGMTKRKETYTTCRNEKYSINSAVKLLDIWCRLRAFAGHSTVIKQYKSQYKDMLAFCECSINKLKPALQALHDMGWINMDEYNMRVHSERHVYALCGLDYKKHIDRTYIKPPKINNEKTTYFWIYVADVSDNRHRQAYMFHKAVMQTPEKKLQVYAELRSQGFNPYKADEDPIWLANRMHAVYLESFHRNGSEMHDFLVENRPDVNRGVNGMAAAWNTCPQNVSYIKKKMVLQGVAFVQKGGTVSSPHWARNKECHRITKDGIEMAKGVLWNKRTQETFQCFCDDIVPRLPFTNDFDFAKEVATALQGTKTAA